MSFWTSLKEQATTISSGIYQTLDSNAHWVWNNVSFSGTVKYTVNTTTQILEQGLALPKAISSIIYNPKIREVAYSTGNILAYDVFPVITLNALNNQIQEHFSHKSNEHADSSAAYSLFQISLTFVDYTIRAYTWRQGIQAYAHAFALSQTAPTAFNSNKLTAPPSLCDDCNYKRKMKGSGRETLILLTNDAVTWGAQSLPHIGYPTAKILSIFFNGRYITRLATPERCERHKAIKQESALALGLSYEALAMSMEYLFDSTIGLPPKMCRIVLRRLLFLWQINLAAHMNIPLVHDKSKECFDPLDGYEWSLRFIFDVLIDGSMRRIPIDFRPNQKKSPIDMLSPTLRSLTKSLNADLRRELDVLKPGYKRAREGILSQIFLPLMFRNAHHFINDPLIHQYWPILRKDLIYTLEQIIDECHSRTIKVAASVPKVASYTIEYKYGIARGVTAFLLLLSQEEDFIQFASALKAWLERHNVKQAVDLIRTNQVPMLGEKVLEPIPEEKQNMSVPDVHLLTGRSSPRADVPSEKLVSKRVNMALEGQIDPRSLMTTRTRTSSESIRLNPHSLFSTRDRKPSNAPLEEHTELEPAVM